MPCEVTQGRDIEGRGYVHVHAHVECDPPVLQQPADMFIHDFTLNVVGVTITSDDNNTVKDSSNLGIVL